MATENAFDAEPSSLEDAVLHHRFDHILAASGRVSAGGRSERRYACTIEVHRQKEYVANYFAHGCRDQPRLGDELTDSVTRADESAEAIILAISLLMARLIC